MNRLRKTASEIHQDIRTGRTSATTVVSDCLSAIERLNPVLNAVIAINPNAVTTAREVDRTDDLGLLAGIPVLIKDNIETRELATTAGSLALAENRTNRDADIIASVRDAGAIVLGKSNLSEWANFRSTGSTSGWSAVGGQCRNPHDPTRNPSGSSSGSAVAVAAGLVPLAIGTETDGSIVSPASICGIVGIKPTQGLLSQRGIVPISHSQDTAGPMANDVASAALLLTAMTGNDYHTDLSPDRLANSRLGVLNNVTGPHERVNAVFAQALEVLSTNGATLIDCEFKPGSGLEDAEYTVLLHEFKENLNRYLATLPGEASRLDLEALIGFNQRNAEREMPYFGQEVFLASQGTDGLDSDVYRHALARTSVEPAQVLDHLFNEHELQALIVPTGGPGGTIDPIYGDHGLRGFSSYPAMSGFPHITVPMGTVMNMPVGLSLIGRSGHDRTLIELAYHFEQAAALNLSPSIHS